MEEAQKTFADLSTTVQPKPVAVVRKKKVQKEKST